MKLPPFALHVPRTLDEALALRAALGSDAKVLAGGQSLLPMMRYRMLRPYALIDITRVASLARLDTTPAVRMGAAVTHADIERCAQAGALFDLLRAHAAEIAFLPVRGRGTVVGSLVHADPAGDWPLLLTALDATVELASLRGRRAVALRDFIRGAMDSDVQVDEIALAVTLPEGASGLARWGRCKLMHRAGEFASASALALQGADGRWACWLGAIDPGPLALPATAGRLAAAGGQPPARRDIAAAALDEILATRPHIDPLAASRHAQAMARAVEQAWQGASA
ncbi:MAG: carbon monoxide dehydrogenase [Alcaligenaceae bacterium]|nr:carbon monoxide dehydrogenase [Alcaligenaceae bacterium SAGV5]MPS53414.1 carbon monoxide dehydrogenase [Alcaligenaceae bacterium SAGV3]MPT56378.1 carbon monoxide dehydrogenase [Alcaligenaceae bacterium]